MLKGIGVVESRKRYLIIVFDLAAEAGVGKACIIFPTVIWSLHPHSGFRKRKAFLLYNEAIQTLGFLAAL